MHIRGGQRERTERRQGPVRALTSERLYFSEGDNERGQSAVRAP